MMTISPPVKMYGIRCVNCGLPVASMVFRQDDKGNWWSTAHHYGIPTENCHLLSGRPVRRSTVQRWAA